MKNNVLKVLLGFTTVSLLIGFHQSADAAIYKCENAQGETYYNDKACPESDKETQLENIEDPVGGYIPPTFKADSDPQGSKGVVVGGDAGIKNTDKKLEELSNSEVGANSNGGSSSDSNSLNAGVSNESVIDSSQSDSGKRTQSKSTNQSVLPTIPLKTEQVTIEARSKIN